MCQSEHGVDGCSQTVSDCTYGAVEPHEVEHALTLVSGDLAYITVCRARRVESFPWKLPAGWYALHVAQGGLDERLRRKVAGTRIAVPANLPVDCIIAVIRLASPKPRRDFDGNPWAMGQWCQAVDDVILLKNCIPAGSEVIRRLWILPEQVRAQVRSSVHAGLQGAREAAASTSLSAMAPCCADAVGQRLSSVFGQQPCATSCKKARILRHSRFPHDSFSPEPPRHIDRLQRLYPHQRDADIRMDEKLHKYYVFGQPYSLSISGWWKTYFEDFDARGISEGIVRRQMDSPGFRMTSGEVADGVLATSVYNFAQRIRILERRSHEEYLDALRSVAIAVVADYASRGVCSPFSAESIVEQGRLCLADSQKPDGPSCYYLVCLYTAALGPDGQAADIVRTWDLNGNLQSLKGTYMHKKIELFINAMAWPMERDGTVLVPVEVLLQEQVPAHEYSAETVLRHIAWAQDAELWDHPLAQRFFDSEMEGESLEFCKFRSWLSTKPHWSPYRVEWSIYNEDLKVAGQIDSLWVDLDNFNMSDLFLGWYGELLVRRYPLSPRGCCYYASVASCHVCFGVGTAQLQLTSTRNSKYGYVPKTKYMTLGPKF